MVRTLMVIEAPTARESKKQLSTQLPLVMVHSGKSGFSNQPVCGRSSNTENCLATSGPLFVSVMVYCTGSE